MVSSVDLMKTKAPQNMSTPEPTIANHIFGCLKASRPVYLYLMNAGKRPMRTPGWNLYMFLTQVSLVESR